MNQIEAQMTEFEDAYEGSLLDTYKGFATKAFAEETEALNEFATAAADDLVGALRWKAEKLMGAQVIARLAKILIHARDESGLPLMSAVEGCFRYLDQCAAQGVTEAPSGHLTGPAFRARGAVALHLKEFGRFHSFVDNARYAASRQVVDRSDLSRAEDAVRDLYARKSRARSEKAIANLDAEIVGALSYRDFERERYLAAAEEAGVPKELVVG